MLKRYNDFIKESVENKGKGVGGDTGFFGKAPKKQTINQSRETMDFLRIGKQISTKNIDGFINGINENIVTITNRLSGEVDEYTINYVMKELSKEQKRQSVDQNLTGGFSVADKKKVNESRIQSIVTIEDDDDEEIDCPDCDGRGKFDDGEKCDRCGGTGKWDTSSMYQQDENMNDDNLVQNINESYDYNGDSMFEGDVYNPEEEFSGNKDENGEEYSEENPEPEDDDIEYVEDDDEPNENNFLLDNEDFVDVDVEDLNDDDLEITDDMLERGTEDNPEGLPNRGSNREMPNESRSWIDFEDDVDVLDEVEPDDADDDLEEDEVDTDGSEDNPITRTKIEFLNDEENNN